MSELPRDHLSAEHEAYKRGRRDALRMAIEMIPSTARDPNEDAYQRGRFDGVIEYQGDLVHALSTSAPPQEASTATAAQVLRITYTNYRGETAIRTIVPKSIRFGATEWHPEPQWLLLAFDVDKNADREFALKDFGAAPPQEATEGPAAIYIASKTRHADMWKALRSSGYPIISTWIDDAGAGEPPCFTALWRRSIAEAATAHVTIVYREPDDVLKGALVEAGAALASKRKVIAVGCDDLSFTSHENVVKAATLDEALTISLNYVITKRTGR